MAQLARLKGVSAAIAALKRRETAIALDVERNLKLAGLFLQAESQKIVPVDSGDLKRSARTRSDGKGFQTIVRVVYLQHYAGYVHEDLNARHKEGKFAKYLERPAREHHARIAAISGGRVSIGTVKINKAGD